MSQSAKFAEERKAIHALRDRYSSVKQMTLAKKIRDRDFAPDEAARDLAMIANANGQRSTLSIYSVIRRYDDSKKPAAAA